VSFSAENALTIRIAFVPLTVSPELDKVLPSNALTPPTTFATLWVQEIKYLSNG
jgi:hypothetical protein